MSEKPNKPNSGKPKLRKTVVKDMPLVAGKAGKVKGGLQTGIQPSATCVKRPNV